MRIPGPLAAFFAPHRFFAESPHGSSFGVAFVVVTVVAVALTAALAGIGLLFVDAIDATVTVDNPDRPPEVFCEGETPEWYEDDCEEPETIDRDAGSILWDVWTNYLPWIFVGTYLLWIVMGLFVHGAARLAGGEGSLAESLAIVGWALPAELLQAAGAVVFFAWLTAGERITADSEAQLGAEIDALVASVPEVNPLAFVVAAWQIGIVAYGLRETHDLSLRAAAVACGVVIGAFSLLAL